MGVLFVDAGHTAADDAPAMGKAGVILFHFISSDKMHRCVVFIKIIGHRLYLTLDAGEVRAFLRNDETLPGVFLAGRQLGILTLPDALHSCIYRNGILACVNNALDPAHRVGMALADALSPEGVVPAFGQNAVHIQAVQREHPWIPAAGDQTDLTALFRRSVDISEMDRNIGMGIEAVHHIEHLGIFRCLDGKVGGAAAADHKDVYTVLHVSRSILGENRNTGCTNADRSRIPAGKYCRQLQIVVLHDRALNTLCKISITEDSDSDTHSFFLLILITSNNRKPLKAALFNTVSRRRAKVSNKDLVYHAADYKAILFFNGSRILLPVFCQKVFYELRYSLQCPIISCMICRSFRQSPVSME